ncbi:MAG TPA: hypothetical protein VEK33_23615 [Terriglobales bacterium]|nr:hypothetical protein [Terriglobales bacterium]
MSASRWCILFIYCLLTLQASAQGYNFNFGGGPGFPLSTTSDFANTSYNLVVGGGSNLTTHSKMNAEFMFHGLPLQQSVIDQVGVANVKGRLYSLSGNLILGTTIGGSKTAYLIGGGGWYRRTLEAKETVLQAGTKCAPVWAWWNLQCVNGIFPTAVTVGSRTSSAPGFNVGGGFGFRLWDSSANFYTEIRYHRAFTPGIDTTVLPLTFGIRW